MHSTCMCPDRLDFLKLFIRRGKADIRAITVVKGTLLHQAVYGPHQSLEYINFLLPFYDGPAFAGPHFSQHDLSLPQYEYGEFKEPAHLYDTILRTAVLMISL